MNWWEQISEDRKIAQKKCDRKKIKYQELLLRCREFFHEEPRKDHLDPPSREVPRELHCSLNYRELKTFMKGLDVFRDKIRPEAAGLLTRLAKTKPRVWLTEGRVGAEYQVNEEFAAKEENSCRIFAREIENLAKTKGVGLTVSQNFFGGKCTIYSVYFFPHLD